jgi:ATP-dependent Clp protease adaptor protein ClpS
MSERQDSQENSPTPERAAGSVVQVKPAEPRLDRLPMYRVLLHNDPLNEMGYVVETICELTTIDPAPAELIMMEAHRAGVALVLMTHRERAELYQEQFATKRLKVSIEPEA